MIECGVFSMPRPFPSKEYVKYCVNLLVPVSIKRSQILKKTYNLRFSLNMCDILLNTIHLDTFRQWLAPCLETLTGLFSFSAKIFWTNSSKSTLNAVPPSVTFRIKMPAVESCVWWPSIIAKPSPAFPWNIQIQNPLQSSMF